MQKHPKPDSTKKIGVVIPAFRVRNQIEDVITNIGPEVQMICVVDDSCPDGSGRSAKNTIKDPRLTVIFHEANQGVGGATKTGFMFLLERNCDVIVKLDGDGQMDPINIKRLISPILSQEADYSKGNRFVTLRNLERMPKIRLIGNVILSFMSKASSGYWNVFDPNNGFVAISAPVLRNLDLRSISQRYFFESDMLFQLGLLRARVVDVPMQAKYEDEKSSLSLFRASYEFPIKHARNLVKRLLTTYFLRDFSLPGFQLIFGSILSLGAAVFGIYNFVRSQNLGVGTDPGTLILFAISLIIGIQFLLGFISHDVQAFPKRAISRDLESIQDHPGSKEEKR